MALPSGQSTFATKLQEASKLGCLTTLCIGSNGLGDQGPTPVSDAASVDLTGDDIAEISVYKVTDKGPVSDLCEVGRLDVGAEGKPAPSSAEAAHPASASVDVLSAGVNSTEGGFSSTGSCPKVVLSMSPVHAEEALAGDESRIRMLASEGLHERAGVVKVSTGDEVTRYWNRDLRSKLEKAAFEDTRWTNAHAFMARTCFADKDPDEEVVRLRVKELLTLGSKSFGLWHLSDEALRPLVNQVWQATEDAASQLSPGLAEVNAQRAAIVEAGVLSPGALAGKGLHRESTMTDKVVKTELKKKKEAARADLQRYAHKKITTLADPNSTKCFKALIVFVVFLACNGYALKVVLHSYPNAVDCLYWPIYIARGGGMACVILSGFLYFYMSRSVWKIFYKFVDAGGFISGLIDMHKDLHMWVGHCLWYAGALHTLAHLVGTAPGVHAAGYEELNTLLGCANPDTTPDYIGVRFEFLQWPKCPLEQDLSFADVLFRSTIGISGILLLLLMCVTRYTATTAFRKAHFDIFMHVHNAAIVLWPLLLFVHGSNGWIGVGFPLIIFTGAVPISFYIIDRILRLVRYYLFVGRATRIVEATVRPGKDGGAAGALTYIKISKPRNSCLWHFWPGTYAFICIPEIAATQWHPFTITSGQDDEHVEFLIHAVGDWTTSLANACLEARGTSTFPRVALDGPFPSPAQSALSRRVLVAVGAGVGFTPFLSLMATIISEVVHNNATKGASFSGREAHFFWMSRSADEFLFGRKLFTEIAQHPVLRETVFLHLHVTAQASDKDVAGFVFREAIKRQSKIDTLAFQAWLKEEDSAAAFAGHLTPWGWTNGTNQDVMWISGLVLDPEEEGDSFGQFVEAKASSSLPRLGSKDTLSYAPYQLREPSSRLLPVYFGRPDFATEVRQIGKQRPEDDVHVYVCGAPVIVKGLEDVVQVCNDHAARDSQGSGSRRQRYYVHHERFG